MQPILTEQRFFGHFYIIQISVLWEVQDVPELFIDDNLEAKLLFQFSLAIFLSFVHFLDHEFSLCTLTNFNS